MIGDKTGPYRLKVWQIPEIVSKYDWLGRWRVLATRQCFPRRHSASTERGSSCRQSETTLHTSSQCAETNGVWKVSERTFGIKAASRRQTNSGISVQLTARWQQRKQFLGKGASLKKHTDSHSVQRSSHCTMFSKFSLPAESINSNGVDAHPLSRIARG